MANEDTGQHAHDHTQPHEIQCPCCLGAGKVISDEGAVSCPLCEGYKTVPVEVAHRFLEVAAKRILGGEAG
jgi:Zn finger protein HypA/HybF involved in hydrogenase expression